MCVFLGGGLIVIDSGERVFVWIGASAPDVEAKLTERTGKVHIYFQVFF